MQGSKVPTIPAELQADHIARTLTNSNELMRRLFAAQGLNGVLRTERPEVVRVGTGRLLRGEA